MHAEAQSKHSNLNLKNKREAKKALTDKLVNIMKDNEIDYFDVKIWCNYDDIHTKKV